MKRECLEIRSSPDKKRAIYVDKLNKSEIKGYLFQDKRHKKKFQFICDIIFGNHRNTELYDKENINEKCKDVTAMKFFKRQENDRIYCKEITSKDGMFIVVACILHEKKKADGNSSKEITLINTVGDFEYDI